MPASAHFLTKYYGEQPFLWVVVHRFWCDLSWTSTLKGLTSYFGAFYGHFYTVTLKSQKFLQKDYDICLLSRKKMIYLYYFDTFNVVARFFDNWYFHVCGKGCKLCPLKIDWNGIKVVLKWVNFHLWYTKLFSK